MREDDRKPHRPFCYVCNSVVRVDFHVPNNVWDLALHHSHQAAYICLNCFTSNADERGVEWSDEIKFYPTSQIKIQQLQNEEKE